MTYQPHLNDGKHVFVFGSNLRGRHGAGAALEAVRHWGAVEGVGVGRQGMAYALPTKHTPTKSLLLCDIEDAVATFIHYASANRDLTFLVTAVGCGLAGYTHHLIAPTFIVTHKSDLFLPPTNCVLPPEFKAVLHSRFPKVTENLPAETPTKTSWHTT